MIVFRTLRSRKHLQNDILNMLAPQLSTKIWMNAALKSSGTHLVGYIQDANGRGHSVKSTAPTYHSQRAISIFAADYDPKRSSKIGNVLIQTVSNPELNRGVHFEKLPTQLKDFLESGKIILNSAATPIEVNPLKGLSFGTGIISFLETSQKIVDKPPYKLLHFSYEDDKTQGRTGILLHRNNDPVLVNIDGKDYCIELKGCGCTAGGIGEKTERSNSTSFNGGLMARSALREFNNLELDLESAACKSGGVLTFDHEGERLGFIVRLTPSTIRASHTVNPALPEAKDAGVEISKAFAQLLVEQITDSHPFLMRNAAHHENILVTPNKFFWTDYSDQHRLGSSEIPCMNGTNLISHKVLLSQVFQGLSEVPYSDFKAFVSEFNSHAHKHNLKVQLNQNDTEQACVEKIYSSVLCQRIYDDRKKTGFSYDKFLTDLCYQNRDTTLEETSWNTLKDSAIKTLRNLQNIPNGITKEGIEKLADALEQNRFSDVVKEIDKYSFVGVIAPLGNTVKDATLELAKAYPFDIFTLINSEKELLANCEQTPDVKKAHEQLVKAEALLQSTLNYGVKGVNKAISEPDFLIKLFNQP